MTNRLWLLGTVVVIGAVVVLGWFLGISPKLAEAAQARADQAAVDAQNSAQEAALAVLREQFDNIDELRAELAGLQRNIPDELGSQEIADQISSLAATYGISIKSIAVAEAEVFGASSEEGAEVETSAPEGVYMVPVTIDVIGDGIPVLQFTQALQTLDHVFFASRFVYEPGAATVTGYVFVVRPPGIDLSQYETDDEPAAEPTPTPTPADTPTPTPEPTETPDP